MNIQYFPLSNFTPIVYEAWMWSVLRKRNELKVPNNQHLTYEREGQIANAVSLIQSPTEELQIHQSFTLCGPQGWAGRPALLLMGDRVGKNGVNGIQYSRALSHCEFQFIDLLTQQCRQIPISSTHIRRTLTSIEVHTRVENTQCEVHQGILLLFAKSSLRWMNSTSA